MNGGWFMTLLYQHDHGRYQLAVFPTAGSWVVVTGSSNALLMWNTLLMMLAPSEAGDQRTGRFGGAHLLDVVIEDGVIIHYATATVLKCVNGHEL